MRHPPWQILGSLVCMPEHFSVFSKWHDLQCSPTSLIYTNLAFALVSIHYALQTFWKALEGLSGSNNASIVKTDLRRRRKCISLNTLYCGSSALNERIENIFQRSVNVSLFYLSRLPFKCFTILPSSVLHAGHTWISEKTSLVLWAFRWNVRK